MCCPRRVLAITIAALLLAVTSPLMAQLQSPNAAGVATGHVHLIVPDLAEHTRIWKLLGGEEKRAGDLLLFAFSGRLCRSHRGDPGRAVE